MRRHVIYTATGAIALLAAVTLPFTAAQAVTTPVPINPSTILSESGPTIPNYCATSPQVVIQNDGDPVVIHMPPAPDFTMGSINSTWWKTPPTSDATWGLSFRALLWLQPIAYYADYNYLEKTYTTAVNQVLAFYAQDPDPGTATSTALANANKWGWDEGTSLRRLTTLNCLYSRRPDSRLLPLMQKEINVQVCPRYYGPPCNAVHNHGMMANEAIYRAGQLANNASWRKLAADRMAYEAPQVYNANGIMKEQSAGYQYNNIVGWGWGADLIRSESPTQAAVLDKAVANGRRALRWMTQPDGRLAQIGGTSTDTPGIASPNPAANSLIDDMYGWAFGRWDWSSPNSMYYVLRYGPGRAYHGLQDRPGVTWSDWGNRILVEPGPYGTDPSDPYVTYQSLNTSQNIAIPSVITQVNKAVTRTVSSIYSTSHAYSFSNPTWPGRAHTRYVAFYGKGTISHRALIRDTFANDPTKTATDNYIRQYFHLDPTWTLASKTTSGAVFRSKNGRTLTMATTGLISSVQVGITGTSPHGWHFPKQGTKLPAAEISIRKGPSSISAGTSTVVETNFTVS